MTSTLRPLPLPNSRNDRAATKPGLGPTEYSGIATERPSRKATRPLTSQLRCTFSGQPATAGNGQLGEGFEELRLARKHQAAVNHLAVLC